MPEVEEFQPFARRRKASRNRTKHVARNKTPANPQPGLVAIINIRALTRSFSPFLGLFLASPPSVAAFLNRLPLLAMRLPTSPGHFLSRLEAINLHFIPPGQDRFVKHYPWRSAAYGHDSRAKKKIMVTRGPTAVP